MNRWFRHNSSDVQHIETSGQNEGEWEMADAFVQIRDFPHLYILVCQFGFALRQASDADRVVVAWPRHISPPQFNNELRAASSA